MEEVPLLAAEEVELLARPATEAKSMPGAERPEVLSKLLKKVQEVVLEL